MEQQFRLLISFFQKKKKSSRNNSHLSSSPGRDRFRTMVNVMGDALATGIMAHICRKDFMKEGDGVSLSRKQLNSQQEDDWLRGSDWAAYNQSLIWQRAVNTTSWHWTSQIISSTSLNLSVFANHSKTEGCFFVCTYKLNIQTDKIISCIPLNSL